MKYDKLALKRIINLIPPGKEVMTGSSTTLDQIGFTEMLKSGKHPWKNLKDPKEYTNTLFHWKIQK